MDTDSNYAAYSTPAIELNNESDRIQFADEFKRIEDKYKKAGSPLQYEDFFNANVDGALFIEKIIKPEMREEFHNVKHEWFEYESDIIKKIPGKFKVEKKGDGMVALASKCYCIKDGNKEMAKSKGSHERFKFDQYKDCLFNDTSYTTHLMGFRVRHDEEINIHTYEVTKIGLNPMYNKRIVYGDRVHTRPITKYDNI